MKFKFVVAGALILGVIACDRSNESVFDEYTDGQDQKFEEQTLRYDKQLDLSEKQAERYQVLLSRWEEQADRFDLVLDALEKKAGISKTQNK
jgi:hypothetical protein